ncbi:hypothetical protein [Flavobacterium sp. FlaQc-48]|uniref:hypothetical protein n=1 Tax=Flavobacterium sp. FlaQc-48 TaxID=3374181 RepID=UPI003756A235
MFQVSGFGFQVFCHDRAIADRRSNFTDSVLKKPVCISLLWQLVNTHVLVPPDDEQDRK